MMAYNGTKLEENDFKEFRESSIRLDLVYQQGMDFFDRHILKIRNGKGFDAPTKFQVDRVAFEGLFINALVHRDYTIKAPIRFFIFKDRLEIHSPGSLPNSLTEESIKKGKYQRVSGNNTPGSTKLADTKLISLISKVKEKSIDNEENNL